ncbi:MAG: KpsF/GutQ family sugar-phosphate isomerase [Chlorobi bacterium]|nr:KpsF/GutQ family sugar-phosphate isomerase [Chlorobiota bacterium]
MMTEDLIRQAALDTVRIEYETILLLEKAINSDFISAVKAIYNCKGRVVFTGIGKSALIAQKIVATFNSTGSPALFMHAADAIHGDLGMMQEDDIVVMLSKSGNTQELKVLVPLIKNFGNPIIAITSSKDSFLAQQADYKIIFDLPREACPNNLAPTASTTAQLVIGDAMAVALLTLKGFSPQDFARFHPGGTLGKKLYLRVDDLYKQNEKPAVSPETPIKDVLITVSSGRLGATAVTDPDNKVLGIITDGDIRRMLQKFPLSSLESLKAKDIMTTNPKTIMPDELAVKALEKMRNNKITQLIVVDKDNHYLGMVHMHDIIREGIV